MAVLAFIFAVLKGVLWALVYIIGTVGAIGLAIVAVVAITMVLILIASEM